MNVSVFKKFHLTFECVTIPNSILKPKINGVKKDFSLGEFELRAFISQKAPVPSDTGAFDFSIQIIRSLRVSFPFHE